MLETGLTELWLPIVLSAVAVFFASFLAWMVFPHHKKDFAKFPKEAELLSLIREAAPKPGPKYMFPHCANPAELKDPDALAAWKAGPHGILDVWPSMPSLGRNLPIMFIFYLVVGVFVAYLAGLALAPGAAFMNVFQFTTTAAIGAYALGTIPNAVWFTKGLRSLAMDLVDNVVYGVITGLIFAWLWADPASVPIG